MPDNWIELFGSSFVSLLLSLMLLRVWFPFGSRRSGSILYETRLSPLRRVLVLRGLLLLLTAYVGLGQVERYFLDRGYYLPGTEYVALGGALIMLSLPMRYVLTDRGVAINNTSPRIWREFRRFDARGNKIVLTPRKGKRPHTLYIPASEHKAVTRVLKRRFR
ncbi:MAG: hypothetical protein CL878_10435 [Dehalococcoidia bacterium]|nr:hypothetical protein [Dehalococcoidia bacterium]